MRVSDIIYAYYNHYFYSNSYKQKIINESIMNLGKEIHRYIQRNMKNQNKSLEPEYHVSGVIDNVDLTGHVDVYDPINQTIYEIKSQNTLKHKYDMALAQASFYYHMLGAKSLKFVAYQINYELIDASPLKHEELVSIINTAKNKVSKPTAEFNDLNDYMLKRLRDAKSNPGQAMEIIEELIELLS